MKKTIFELSIDSKILFDRLSVMQKGDFISYEDLSNLVQKDVQKSGRGNLTTARRMAQRECGLIFAAVVNEGLRALTDEQIAMGTGEEAIKRIKNISRRSSRKLTSISDFESLSSTAKIRHNAHLGLMGVFLVATAQKSVKKIEGRVESTGEKVPTNGILELFK